LAFILIEQWVPLRPESFILDIGCGSGGNVKKLNRYGRAIGLDLSPIALYFARQRHLPHLTQGSGLSLPYPDKTFDLVTVFDVLYHRWITDDKQALQEIYRVIRSGGWLLITDSALPLLWSTHDEIYYARQRYTLEDIERKVTQVGFEPRISSYTNTLLLPIFFSVRLAMNWLPVDLNVDRQGTVPELLNRFLTFVRNLEAMWLRQGRTLPIGSSLISLSQKTGGNDKAS
jgi:ubiquinone/menaquinone biosynthesis C-methylase UbiE